ncbi:MAG: TadE family type IV pilus minor pilin [Microbacterium sp.]|uniref:TadE family type IV pilus minor pilin n=1 Tax=Microbacterium sp. TaxID=51671 RepID=UPI003A87A31D
MRGDRGSVTAEFAIVLPVLVLLIVFGVGALGATSARVRLEDAAADAARLVARGDDPAAAHAAVGRAADGARLHVARHDGLVCVTASAAVRVLGALVVPVQAGSCALDGGR